MPASIQKSAAQKKWKMPFAVYTGASQLEVITVIANCGTQTDLATDAIYNWILAKQAKGRTRYEILGKLELLENKFLPFSSLHDCFRVARRATGLPPSRILSGDVPYSGQASLNMLVEESTSVTIQTRDSPVPAEPELSPADKSQSSGPEPNELCPTPIETGFADSEVLDFEGKRPPPLRLRNLLDARRSRMARRHSICVASPVSPLDEEVSVPSRKNPLSFGHIRRRSSIGSSTSRGVTSTSSYRPTWGTPSVAFDPPAPPSMTYSDSSPDSGVDVDSPASRPSTSASSYYAPTRTPSVTSFQIMDSVRQSFQQAKFDPEMAETLFQGTTAQNFLRIFRPE